MSSAGRRDRWRLPLAYRAWCAGCAALLALLLLARAVHYAVPQLPGPVDRALGVVLIYETLLFFGTWIVTTMFPELVVAALLLGLVLGRRHLFRRYDGAWGSHPLLYAGVWTGFVLGHAAFDLHPRVAAPAFASLLLLGFHDTAPARSRLTKPALLAAAAGACAYVTWHGDGWSLAALLLWLGLLAALLRVGERVLLRDRLCIALAGIVGVQVFASIGPSLLPTHGGRLLVRDMAYDFCETDGRLYATLTRCPTLPHFIRGREACKRGRLAEFDLDALSLRAEHDFFAPDYYGRLEQLVCLDDAVEIGLNGVVSGGRETRDGAIGFEIDRPERFVRNRVGPGAAHRVAWDAKRDALFYAPEWGHGIRRYDRATEKVDWIWLRPSLRLPIPMLDEVRDSYEFGPESISTGRDSAFFAEWIGGSVVHEVDLASLEEVARYPAQNGGAVGVAVDDVYGRLYVVGLWGMEVIDLSSGDVVLRRRLGLLSRAPVIDERRGLVYVPSTVEGRIRVFDRETLALRGTLAVGFGVRLLHLSAATDRLFASSWRAAWSWPASELAP